MEDKVSLVLVMQPADEDR